MRKRALLKSEQQQTRASKDAAGAIRSVPCALLRSIPCRYMNIGRSRILDCWGENAGLKCERSASRKSPAASWLRLAGILAIAAFSNLGRSGGCTRPSTQDEAGGLAGTTEPGFAPLFR